MIHLIVFLVKMIVKLINGNKESVRTTGVPTSTTMSSTSSNSSTNGSTNDPITMGLGVNKSNTSVTVGNKTGKTEDQKMLYAFLLSIFFSCFCGLGFLVNIILAFIIKKVPHIITTSIITILIIISFVFYFKESEKKLNEPEPTCNINYNDTLIINLPASENVRDNAKKFVINKYTSCIKDTVGFYNSLGVEMMCFSIFSHKFDTLYVNGVLKEYTSIDEALYTPIEEISQNSNSDQEYATQENLSSNNIVVFLQEKDRTALYDEENNLILGKYDKKEDKYEKVKENIYIFPLAILFLISFFYSFFLWYSFFYRDKDENKDMIDSMNNTRSKPTTTNIPIQRPSMPNNRPIINENKPVETPTASNTNRNVDRGNKTIGINTVDVYNLMTIPVLNYSQALIIISERSNNGKYTSLDDVQNRNSLSNETIQVIAKYVYID